jgi:hypothetical protein
MNHGGCEVYFKNNGRSFSNKVSNPPCGGWVDLNPVPGFGGHMYFPSYLTQAVFAA